MNKLKIAVIGTGLVGSFHAETFFRNPNSELIAVCDIDKEKVNKIANRFKCKAYNEFESLINTEKLDAISIATPEQIRIAPALLAIEKGLKILLEKPLGRNLEDIENLVNKIKNHNKLISVNFILHEDPRYKLMKEKSTRPCQIKIGFANGNSPRPAESLKIILEMISHLINKFINFMSFQKILKI